MKRPLLISFVLLISKFALCQTPIQSFKSQPLPDMQGFNQSQIDSFISKASIENFRLLDKRDTLTFDNGFDIILLSAKELIQLGIIKDATSYEVSFPARYRLPKFHMNEKGMVCAEYFTDNHTKYLKGK